MIGSVWPKSTLAITGRPASSGLPATIWLSRSRVMPVAFWNRPVTTPVTPGSTSIGSSAITQAAKPASVQSKCRIMPKVE
jgi:hypothetical protein